MMVSRSFVQFEGCGSVLASAVRIKVKAIGVKRRNDHSTGRGAVAARPGDRRRGAVIDAGRQPKIAEATNDVEVAPVANTITRDNSPSRVFISESGVRHRAPSASQGREGWER
jgi:hypothetical protein